MGADRARAEAGRHDRRHPARDTVQTRVVTRDGDGDRIDVARHDRRLGAPGDRDGKHARSRPEVEGVDDRAAPGKPVDGDQAPGRRAVVAGPEGEASVDLDGDVVREGAAAIVTAVDEEAPGAHRR